LAFICFFLTELHKTTRLIFQKFGGKVARWPWKKRLDFGGKLDNIVLGLG